MGEPGPLVPRDRRGGRSWCLRRVGMDAEWLLLEDGKEVSGRPRGVGVRRSRAWRGPRGPGPRAEWKRAGGSEEEDRNAEGLGERREKWVVVRAVVGGRAWGGRRLGEVGAVWGERWASGASWGGRLQEGAGYGT